MSTRAAKLHSRGAVPQIMEANRRQARPGGRRPEPLGHPARPQRRAVLLREHPAGVLPAVGPLQALEELVLLPLRQHGCRLLIEDDDALGVLGLGAVQPAAHLGPADVQPRGHCQGAGQLAPGGRAAGRDQVAVPGWRLSHGEGPAGPTPKVITEEIPPDYPARGRAAGDCPQAGPVGDRGGLGLAQELAQLLSRQTRVPENRSQRSLRHVLPGVDRHRGGAPIRMLEPAMAAANPAACNTLTSLAPVTAGNGDLGNL